MTLKISNIRNPETFEQLYRYKTEYVTINLNQKSHNYIGEVDPAILSVLPNEVKRCGLFATANTMQIISKAGRYNLDAVELQGNQITTTMCEQLTAEGIEVIKLISQEQIDTIQKFEGLCNKYVFNDLSLEQINTYSGSTPVMLTIGKNEFDLMCQEGKLEQNEKLFMEKSIIGYDINFNE